MNNLDAVWASLSSADRVVLLGHDRDLLTDADKTRLASVAAAKADRRAEPRSRRTGNRTGARNAATKVASDAGRSTGRGAGRPRNGSRGRRAA